MRFIIIFLLWLLNSCKIAGAAPKTIRLIPGAAATPYRSAARCVIGSLCKWNRIFTDGSISSETVSETPEFTPNKVGVYRYLMIVNAGQPANTLDEVLVYTLEGKHHTFLMFCTACYGRVVS